jgi:hypothetical protein
MPLQSSNLVMLALGIAGDAPPVPLQPKLPDGVHLRWARPRADGFPWQGYFLFRRPHEKRTDACVAETLRGLAPGPVAVPLETAAGTLVSDAPLAVVQELGANGLDLAGRAWLRLDLPRGAPCFRADVTLGLRGKARDDLVCADLAALGRAALPNPLVLGKAEFRLIPTGRRRGPATLLRDVATVDGLTVATDGELAVTLPEPAQSLEVSLAGAGTLQIEALDAAGAVVARRRVKQAGTFAAGKPFIRLRLAAAQGAPVLTRLCWRPAVPAARTRLRLVALDGTMEVAATTLEGAEGDRVAASLQADRITALRLEGGAAVPTRLTESLLQLIDGSTGASKPSRRRLVS